MERLAATGNGQVPAVAAAAWDLLVQLRPKTGQERLFCTG
jgi:hypothetical protein